MVIYMFRMKNQKKFRKRSAKCIAAVSILCICMSMCGCSTKTPISSVENKIPEESGLVGQEETASDMLQNENSIEDINQRKDDSIMTYKKVDFAKSLKTAYYTNPLITQHFGADPYAMEYDGRIYIYMTADAFEYDAAGEVKENTYSKIRSIYVISTDDMINFTDHGEINIANPGGAAIGWAHNSWAPAACWKEIDGKPKFFLYFADNGGGIGVLSADSPTGPFTDPLGHALIHRGVPTCAEVLWLFDPAVLVDDDGSAYIYFGGGVPEGKAAAPGTGRVCKLGADMISLDGDPVALDVPYLFEDSGIHKFNNKYYYTYSTNFSVDAAGTEKYKFGNGDIAMLESDSPMGPFVYKEMILQNPGVKFKLGGNNHHCVFNFKGQWYITYHARTLEQKMGIEKGYRSTHIDVVNIQEDGTIGHILQTYDGRTQLKNVNPYEINSAVNCAFMAGTVASPADEDAKRCGSGNMYLDKFDAGDYIKVAGVDFGADGASKLKVTAASPEGDAEIYFALDYADRYFAGVKVAASDSEKFAEYTGTLTGEATGVHDLFIVCGEGTNVQMLNWCFE